MGNGESTEDEPTPDEEPDEPTEDGEPRSRRWVPHWPERWTHGAVTLGVLAALVALFATVLAFDYLADRAGDVVVESPEGSDVPYTPGDTTGTTDPGVPTGSEPPVSGPTTGLPPTATVPPPLGTATGETCVPSGETTDISVVSFNIKSARGPGGVRIDLLAQTLATWKPDVVLLQEVDKNRPISGSIDMPAYLGEKLGYYSTFGTNVLRPGDSQYGTAILSRFPITASENTLLPRLPGTQQRGLLHATIDVDGTALSTYVTHLENTSADARQRQIEAIRDLVADDAGPLLLGGDFNSTPSTPVMSVARAIAQDTWLAAGDGSSGLTAPNSNPRVRIDYLLYRGAVTPTNMQILTPPVSDHRALYARYTVGTADTVCLPVFG
jgi:endonuclease/exonuclease/phosphatase family metal-dependent hydrolase